jgi:pantothenate kinase
MDMATASIEVSGLSAERLAGELHAALGAVLGPGEGVSRVEVSRSAELVVAVVGLVFSGVSAAKTVWDWWQSRRSEGVKVIIVFDDGTHVDLAGVDRGRLEIELERRATLAQ